MTNYVIEHKSAFTVTGYGATLEMPYDAIPAQKAKFWELISTDGRWQRLKKAAKNQLEFAVNEAINGAMWYYAGVETDETIADATRLIEFPDAEYLVVEGSAETPLELFSQLEGQAFGEALGSLDHYAYTGGPNVAVQTAIKEGRYYGQMWIPLTEK